jgi:hypothetical protein
MIHVVTLRLVYLVVLRLISWAALFARSDASKDAEIPVLGHLSVHPRSGPSSNAPESIRHRAAPVLLGRSSCVLKPLGFWPVISSIATRCC